MGKRAQIHILNFLLFILIAFAVCALYMSWNARQESSETAEAYTADYHYEEVQALVEDTPDSAPYDIEEMLAINPDFKGWLQIPDTDVNYPVVYSPDNNTYLYRSFQGEYSAFGSLFLDQNSIPGAQNRVIHGHNMGINRTEMFSCLVNYQDPEWAGERPYAYFTEPDHMQDNCYQLFAVLNFNINHLDEFDYFQTDFETDENYREFVQYLKSRSLFETDFSPEHDILILSTCNRAKGGADNRLLVCFGRVDPSELYNEK